MVLIAESKNLRMVHPFHLHGHAFRVLAQAEVGTMTTISEVKAMDKSKLKHTSRGEQHD